jgi:hypothetical protein
MSGEVEMGRVVVPAVVEILEDQWNVARGRLLPGEVRRVKIEEARVDTDAAVLCLPSQYNAQLGLMPSGQRESMTSARLRTSRMFGPVKLIVQRRHCNVDILECADEAPVSIGQVPLELLDFVVDAPGRRSPLGISGDSSQCARRCLFPKRPLERHDCRSRRVP